MLCKYDHRIASQYRTQIIIEAYNLNFINGQSSMIPYLALQGE